ncbi:hypothetical protein GEMRC1_002232 [Eukaryota sp. GEM-RC1]
MPRPRRSKFSAVDPFGGLDGPSVPENRSRGTNQQPIPISSTHWGVSDPVCPYSSNPKVLVNENNQPPQISSNKNRRPPQNQKQRKNPKPSDSTGKREDAGSQGKSAPRQAPKRVFQRSTPSSKSQPQSTSKVSLFSLEKIKQLVTDPNSAHNYTLTRIHVPRTGHTIFGVPIDKDHASLLLGIPAESMCYLIPERDLIYDSRSSRNTALKGDITLTKLEAKRQMDY